MSRRVSRVGDLAALTEYDVSTLPLRLPKISHTRRILEEFARRNKLLEVKENDNHDAVDPAVDDTGLTHIVTHIFLHSKPVSTSRLRTFQKAHPVMRMRRKRSIKIWRQSSTD